jgi:hypothetical protein
VRIRVPAVGRAERVDAQAAVDVADERRGRRRLPLWVGAPIGVLIMCFAARSAETVMIFASCFDDSVRR